MIRIKKHFEDSTLFVFLEGKMDTVTTPEVTAAIDEDTNTASAVVIDMKDLSYLSSAGLRLLLSLHKKMALKDGLKIRNVNSDINDIFDMTGFSEILDIE